MKMKVTVVAEFEIPDRVVLHDAVFESEGVFFHPEISFDCVEVVDGEGKVVKEGTDITVVLSIFPVSSVPRAISIVWFSWL